ncbi:Uncharacterized conserved protein [Ceraceosorus bombacis]|uniref:Uncharacterized conserved protein n=1 Tax=Ceraceosorus bombacis TaxID=401625 RepID=A0A0N7L943_9BASI|nr:Uncharacterized conserved protein [Ceraceosorus bombacis]
MTSQQPNQSSVDLSTLPSYSSSWTHPLRLTTCLAVQYSSRRLTERLKALESGSTSQDRGGSTSQDEDFSLGVSLENDVKELNLGDDAAESGRMTSKEQSWAAERKRRSKQVLREDWEDYCARFLTATCQHLGISEEILPPGDTYLSDILDASRGRPVKLASDASGATEAEPQAAEHETGSSREWATKHNTKSQSTSTEPSASDTAEQVQNGSTKADGVDEEAVREMEEEATTTNEQLAEVSKLVSSVQRGEGALTDKAGQGKDVEVVHDLLLVALGLGQYRASDGATTLFESDSVFDPFEPNAGSEAKDTHRPAGDRHAEEKEQYASHDTEKSIHALATGDSTPSPLPIPEASAPQQDATNVGAKTWSAISGGAKTGWRGVSGAARDGASFVSSGAKTLKSSAADKAEEAQIGERKSAKKTPTKPNDPFRYDARARAVIWVAALSMGIETREITGAEKVMAQSVYFIMEQGRSRAQKEGKSDPLVEANMLKAASSSSTSDEAASARKDWMNRASEQAVTKEKSKANWGKWAATGAGFAIGGVAIGLTGGLAAPFVLPALAGLTGVGFLATTGGVVMMGTLLGLGGGGLAGYRITRRLRGVSDFAFSEISSNAAREAGLAIPSLNATICVSGLILDERQQTGIWADALSEPNTPEEVAPRSGKDQEADDEAANRRVKGSEDADIFAVECEKQAMAEAGRGLNTYTRDALIRTGASQGGQAVLKTTALAGLAAITLPLTVYSAASAALDSYFVRAKTRSHKAGLLLADVLKDKVQGERPVVLIGTSLGCTTILTALLELAKEPDNAKLVSDVFLIGAPITPSLSELKQARSIVSRRFVNAFSSKDMVCSIAAYLGSTFSLEDVKSGRILPRVLGSRACLGVPGLENVDIADLAPGHYDLLAPGVLAQILERLGALTD